MGLDEATNHSKGLSDEQNHHVKDLDSVLEKDIDSETYSALDWAHSSSYSAGYSFKGGNQYREGSIEAESGVRLYISEERKERYDRGRRGLRAGDNSNNSSDDEVDD